MGDHVGNQRIKECRIQHVSIFLGQYGKIVPKPDGCGIGFATIGQNQSATNFSQACVAGKFRAGGAVCQGVETLQGRFNVALVVDGQDLIERVVIEPEFLAVHPVFDVLEESCTACQYGKENHQA
ncbi:hypothetical protein DESC_780201 [Desulfosarcina cetonica]|nr:hypothetical protein DESC_780201 [Desulfosarcina cetonica]